MEEFITAGCVVLAILCVAHMLRPVGRAEKAYLLELAQGDQKSQEAADKLVAKKWLTWVQYDALKQLIKGRKAKIADDALIAESAARKAVRDAQKAR